MAILTRPNPVVFAAIVGVFAAWQGGIKRLAWFALGVIPGCLAVAFINDRLFGSPLESGYGALSALYARTNILPNLDRYPRWLVQTHTPFIVLGLFAPARLLLPSDADRGGSVPRRAPSCVLRDRDRVVPVLRPVRTRRVGLPALPAARLPGAPRPECGAARRSPPAALAGRLDSCDGRGRDRCDGGRLADARGAGQRRV